MITRDEVREIARMIFNDQLDDAKAAIDAAGGGTTLNLAVVNQLLDLNVEAMNERMGP